MPFRKYERKTLMEVQAIPLQVKSRLWESFVLKRVDSHSAR